LADESAGQIKQDVTHEYAGKRCCHGRRQTDDASGGHQSGPDASQIFADKGRQGNQDHGHHQSVGTLYPFAEQKGR